jgi:hypothetical protein
VHLGRFFYWLGLAHPSGPTVSMGWQPTPKTGELPPWRRAGGADANPARAGDEWGSGGVLEHEVAVGDWFEETEERGAHQKWRLHGDSTLSVGTHRRRLGTVVGVADSESGEHLGAGGVLGEAKARLEEDQSGPPAVECPAAEEEEGRSSLRSEGGGCSSAWLVEANTRAAALAAGGTSGRFTSVAYDSGEERNDIGGRARAREMAMVLAI